MYFDNFFKSVLFFLTATKHASSQNLSPWNITKNLTYMGNINKYAHKQKTLKTVIFFHVQWGILMQALMWIKTAFLKISINGMYIQYAVWGLLSFISPVIIIKLIARCALT